MLWFGAVTFHQLSQRNIAVQADAKWAFIVRIQNGHVGWQTCDDGTRWGSIALNSCDKIYKKKRKKKARSIELRTHEVTMQPRAELETATAPKRVGVNNDPRSWFYHLCDVMFIGDSMSRLCSAGDEREGSPWVINQY